MEYTLRSGKVVTDEQIKRAAEQEGESRSAFLRKAALDRAESVLAAS